MPWDEKLAARIRELITQSEKRVEEKPMFGGVCFMVNDKMCVGVKTDRILVRHDPALYETLAEKKGCATMEMQGKLMKGFLFVEASELASKKDLAWWVQLALEYNKIAKASTKKKKK